MQRRVNTVWGYIFSCATMLVGANALAAGEAAKKVTVCLPQFRHEFLSLVTLEAMDQGFFKKHGLEVDVNYSSRSGKGLQKWKKEMTGNLTAGGVDRNIATHVGYSPQVCQFGSSNVDRFISDADALKATAPVMVSMYGQEYDTHLVVAKDSKIKTVADLKGKVVRVGQLPTLLGVRGALEEAGLSIKDVDLSSDFDAVEKVAALSTGKVDALTTYMPLMSYMMATGNFRVLKANIVKTFVSPTVPHSLLIVNKQYAAQNPAVVDAYKAAMNEAYAYIMRNPSEIIHIVERHSQEMTGENWKVPKVIAEKAGSFMGKVIMADITPKGDAQVRAKVNCEVRNYNKLVQSKGYAKEITDLSGWLNVSEADKACPESAQKTAALQ